MKKIYTGIDLGSDSIKIVVSEFLNDKFYCLASTSVRSVGIKNGLITDETMAANSLKIAISEIEKITNVKIDEAVVAVPSNDVEITIEEGRIEFPTAKEFNGNDIINVLKDAIVGKISNDRELVTVFPISFTVDNDKVVIDPKKIVGSNLIVKAVVTTIPKPNMYKVFKVLNECNINIKDVTFGAVGDYFQLKGKDTDEKVGVIINIGSETTNISVFNKGIMIKNAIIEIGSKFVDNDISYIYKIDRKTARKLKETFAVSSKRYADITDTVEVENKNHEKIKINQHEISNIVEERLIQILKLAKKQISILTNREISYIIITGGISELPGFQYVVDTIFSENAYTANSTILGIRSNKYTTAIGIIKYFYKKLEFREKENYTMFDDKKCYDLVSSKKKMNLSINAIFEKVFGYF